MLNGCAIFQQTKLDKKWPQKLAFIDRFDFDRNLVREGFIITVTKDTLKGYFKIYKDYGEFNGEPKPVPFVPFGKTKVSDITNLKLNDIDRIRARQPNGVDSVDYIPYKSAICMLLGKEKKYTYSTINGTRLSLLPMGSMPIPHI